MDHEMRAYLEGMEARLNGRQDDMETRLMTRINDNQERLLERMRGFEMVLASLVDSTASRT
jgi:hypothetical protein